MVHLEFRCCRQMGYARETEILKWKQVEWVLTWFKKVEKVKEKIYNKKSNWNTLPQNIYIGNEI